MHGTEKTTIEVRRPSSSMPGQIPAIRIPLGIPGDYKPNLGQMPDGELLLTAFHSNAHKVQPGQRPREDILLFRSRDGGATWSDVRVLGKTFNLLGREPYLSVLRDGTILLTCHFLEGEERNDKGYVMNFIHRSDDGGETWSSLEVSTTEFPPRTQYSTTRNILEMDDGTLMLVVTVRGTGALVWISEDRGISWKKKCDARIIGLPEGYSCGIFEESHLKQTAGGRLVLVSRVDHRYYPIAGRIIDDEEFKVINQLQLANGWPPVEKCPHCGYRSITDKTLYASSCDQFEHMKFFLSDDGGATWHPGEDIGDYGMMYPSILRLGGDKVLLTFTVRHVSPPLGVRGVLGRELADGFAFDFGHNQFVLDDRTPLDRASGGGFGNTVRVADGTLVTTYSYRGADNDLHLEVIRWNLP